MAEDKRYWPSNATYFLTGSTFLHFPYFRDAEQKQLLLNKIKKAQERFDIANIILSIAIHHYHLKIYMRYGLDLAKLKQLLHGGTSYEYKRRFSMKYKNMWQSSKTYQVLSEEMDWKVTGYIIGNLLKHREVTTFQELKESPFLSYDKIAKQYGKKFICELVRTVIDVEESSLGVADIEQFKKLKVAHHRLKSSRI